MMRKGGTVSKISVVVLSLKRFEHIKSLHRNPNVDDAQSKMSHELSLWKEIYGPIANVQRGRCTELNEREECALL